MEEILNNFPEQFKFNPAIENERFLNRKNKIVFAGMGGSHLAGGLIKMWRKSSADIYIHRNYGLPPIRNEDLKQNFLIASSYSGNTEEIIDFFEESAKKNFIPAAISTGGKLIELAKKITAPYVLIPKTEAPARCAIGFSLMAVLKLLGEEDEIKILRKMPDLLEMDVYREEGKKIADDLFSSQSIPIIYSSLENSEIAYNWKIRFNETGKSLAFSNVFPELNHNEIVSFGKSDFFSRLFFIFIENEKDDERIKKRMKICHQLCQKTGAKTLELKLKGENFWHKVFSSLLTADWSAYYLAQKNGFVKEEDEIIKEFKKSMDQFLENKK